HLPNFVADKHSTGGVGDKVSIILGPLMASAGLAIPMISGRSLGHTGGTLDKLESIPGYCTDLSLRHFRQIVEEVGISMIGQTNEICPADKKMYALRDATSTIHSIPLIVSSIMSKKIAEGIQGLVIDLKVGTGAFMHGLEANELAEKLKMAGEYFGVSTNIIFTNMDQPLGEYAGLWCEINECIQALQGKGPDDLMDVTYTLGNSLLLQSKIAEDEEEAKNIQQQHLSDGSAYKKFVEMVKAHGGDPSFIENPDMYEKPRYVAELTANHDGYIVSMDTFQIGLNVNDLTILCHHGKRNKDNSGGIRFLKKIGEQVKNGQVIATCFGNEKSRVNRIKSKLTKTIKIGETPPPPLVLF
nr:thymidine phosphorylase [Candidatus Neomarinimicrobiota bacterium]